MNINYKDLLPVSNTCEEVSVSCNDCPASVSNVQIEKR